MRSVLPKRKRLRLKNYDYSQAEFYFITICLKNRIKLLGKIKDINYIELTREGKIVKQYIENIEQIYKNTAVDEYIIMPNHIHMILIINDKNKVTISRVIKQYKMYVSKEIGYSIWQRSFYEHIIRNEKEYLTTKKYIKNNIINWERDEYL